VNRTWVQWVFVALAAVETATALKHLAALHLWSPLSMVAVKDVIVAVVFVFLLRKARESAPGTNWGFWATQPLLICSFAGDSVVDMILK
jgi:hypothetical protein